MNSSGGSLLRRHEMARARLQRYGRPVVQAMGAQSLNSTDSPQRTRLQFDRCPSQRGVQLPQNSSVVFEVARHIVESFVPVIVEFACNRLRRTIQYGATVHQLARCPVYERDRTALQKYGERGFDESKHPRAARGRADGGQFISKNSPTDSAAQAQVLTVEPPRQLHDMLTSVTGLIGRGGFDRGRNPVAESFVSGVGQGFFIDGLLGAPQMIYDLAKSKAEFYLNLPGEVHTFLTSTVPSVGSKIGDVIGRYWADRNEALADFDGAMAKFAEVSQKASDHADLLFRIAQEIRRLDLSSASFLLQDPEKLDGHVSDELLLMIVITQGALAEFRELDEYIRNIDDKTKAYVVGYVFGAVLYEVAELFVTRAATAYVKTAKFGRLLKKMEKLPFVKNNPRAKVAVAGMIRRIFRVFGTEACFVAGTKVQTPSGPANIEDLDVGDLVLSRDESDVTLAGPVVVRRVTRRIVTHSRMLWHISFRSTSGTTETLVTTGSHPFFVADHAEFIAAATLQPNQTLVMRTGATAKVINVCVEHAGSGQSFTTYNLEIADAHTYFVGDAGIWVHNVGKLTCELMDEIYERYRRLGYTDELAQAKTWKLFNDRVTTGRYKQRDFEDDWGHAKRYFRPDGIFESELSYATRVLGHKPKKKVFPITEDNIGADPEIGRQKPRPRPYGSREYDHFDSETETAFEFNQSPWSSMNLEQLRNKVKDKINELHNDVVLVNPRRRKDKKVKQVRWIMTEKLPTAGEPGQIVKPLREELEAARKKWPRKFTIEVHR